MFTSTFLVTSTVTPTINASDRAASSSSHTGAIVGGVVGGVAGLAILAAVLFMLCRRSRRHDFDGNFDPDRVVGLTDGRDGPVDLIGAENVTPYSYTPTGYGAANGAGTDEMRQAPSAAPSVLAGGLAGAGTGAAMGYGAPNPPPKSAPSQSHSQYSQSQSQYSSSAEQYPDYAAYAGYANQPQQAYDPSYQAYDQSRMSQDHSYSSGGAAGGVVLMPGGEFRQPSPGPSMAMSNSTYQSQPGSHSSPNVGLLPSAKEREVMTNRMRVANDGPVMQHQDGGRLDSTPEEEDGPTEIPPRYDDIPRDR